ncbi:uncharacterized protein SCHCODRAFT_02560098 [Schizophyllum commune H4-8]|uniref:F-box domain-containing protein n=1 Tax=Schizophyllum commune (strain H4-8 / FGSC 9210) TaxID=578458 RepID=D8PTN0_SCHCM|nr:uncharacterized protein SCHCODRAFT_02560098 [Schizophyllum commune H4-8]KAI5899243.1 hypothetical protein SCHCODRAFT_02560098 [Schizophyllum commune H4-8]
MTISTLPTELLAEVLYTARAGESTPSSALRLAQVSQRWRETAFGDTRLWTRLTLEDGQAIGENSVKQAHAWIQRAHPLHVSLELLPMKGKGGFMRSGPPSPVPHLLDDGLSYIANRVSDLNLAIPTEVIREFREHPPRAFPNLVKLRLAPFSRVALDEYRMGPSSEMLITCERLRCLVITEVDLLIYERLDRSLTVPWQHLEELELGNVCGYHAVATVFRQCSRLRRAAFHAAQYDVVVDHIDSEPPAERKDVTYPFLASLTCGFHDTWPAQLLEAAQFPALTSLTLAHHSYDAYPDFALQWSGLHALAERSPALNALTLRHLPLNGDAQQLKGLLRRTPELRTLILEECRFDNVGDLSVFYDSNPPMLLPRLEVLRIPEVDLGTDDAYLIGGLCAAAYDCVLNLLRFRLGPTPLREFRIGWRGFDYNKVPLMYCTEQVMLIKALMEGYEDKEVWVEGVADELYGRLQAGEYAVS